MEELELTGAELYEINAQIRGLTNTQTNQSIFKGLINEKISEGVKRFAERIAKVIDVELTTLKESRAKLFVPYVDNHDLSVEENDKLNKTSQEEQNKKDQELLNDKIKISIEKIDFKKIEDCVLSENYQYLYDRIFKNA